uniref:Uncharacterized protein n=1 Tax=Rhizophora mucronata TaxID=61149 RepID=A0A2P2PAD6_RHIMU
MPATLHKSMEGLEEMPSIYDLVSLIMDLVRDRNFQLLVHGFDC